jgi:hypothetical protein
MGTKSNLKYREVTVHVDDEACRQKIEKARKIIFQKGAGIEGKHVKDILSEQSLVPMQVSVSLPYIAYLA